VNKYHLSISLTITLAISLIIVPLNTQASNLINNERVTDQKNCFSWVFSDYNSWRNMMSKKYKKKIKSPEKREQA